MNMIEQSQVVSEPMAAQEVPYALRLPEDLHRLMTMLAAIHDRSLNKEIVAACRKWVKDHADELPAEREG